MDSELKFGGVVEIVARALYAHQRCPGADPMTVKWPPENKSALGAYWNKALAVVKAQHDYVRRREDSTCTVEIASPSLRFALRDHLTPGPEKGAKLHSGSIRYRSGGMSGLPDEDSCEGSASPGRPLTR